MISNKKKLGGEAGPGMSKCKVLPCMLSHRGTHIKVLTSILACVHGPTTLMLLALALGYEQIAVTALV